MPMLATPFFLLTLMLALTAPVAQAQATPQPLAFTGYYIGPGDAYIVTLKAVFKPVGGFQGVSVEVGGAEARIEREQGLLFHPVYARFYDAGGKLVFEEKIGEITPLTWSATFERSVEVRVDCLGRVYFDRKLVATVSGPTPINYYAEGDASVTVELGRSIDCGSGGGDYPQPPPATGDNAGGDSGALWAALLPLLGGGLVLAGILLALRRG